jgi:hypothetical protein
MAQGRGLNALKRRFKFSKRTWRIIAIAVGVVALAVVVLVSASLSTPSREQSPEVKAVAQQMESESLTDRGITALSANDTATAETLLQRAVALNPQNKRATIALAQLRQSTTTASNGGASGTSGTSGGTGSNGGSTGGSNSNPSKPTPGPFDKQVDISKLLPVAASGFTMYQPQVTGAEAQISGEPATKGVRVIWAVHDRGSVSAAAKFITAVSKRAYAKDAQSASIDGASAYLGTDGTRYATAVYVRGRYVFEVLVSLATPSADIKQALPIARDAAVAFPDTP